MSSANEILAAPGVLGATWKLSPSTEVGLRASGFTEAFLPGDWNPGEDVFEPDNRLPSDASDYADGGKYRSIVKLVMRYEGMGPGDKRYAIGTGWLVSPDTFVTAGHCVFDINASTLKGLGRVKEMRVYIGYRGKESVTSPNVQQRKAVNVATTVKWVTKGDRRGDVAFVRVDKPFTGKLQTFKFQDTPVNQQGALLGVVGYPGDKLLNGVEKGGQMYELFESTAYNLTKNEFNMLGYTISTFKGQSGAPVIQKDKEGERVVIGTHCYGGGSKNSASVIGGAFGVPYKTFLQSLLQPDSNIKDITGKAISTLEVTGTGTGPTESDFDTEGFFDVLKSIGRVVAPIAQTALTIGSPLLGPLGAPISAIGGVALGALNNAVAESGFTEADMDPPKLTKPIALTPGTAERAVLAESALQTVLRMERSPASESLLSSIQEKYTASGFTTAHAEKLGPKLVPLLSQAGLRLATTKTLVHKETTWAAEATPLPNTKPSAGEADLSTGDATADAFLRITGAVKVTKATGDPETESFFENISSFLSRGLSVAKPILLTSARAGLKKVDEMLARKETASGGESDLIDAGSEAGVVSDEKAAMLLAHRAVVAECALQAVLEADEAQLKESVILGGVDGAAPEGFLDGLFKAVQVIGPAVVKVAPAVLSTAVPHLLNALTGGSTGSESAVVGAPVPSEKKGMAAVNGLNGVSKQVSGGFSVDGLDAAPSPAGGRSGGVKRFAVRAASVDEIPGNEGDDDRLFVDETHVPH